MSLDTNALLKAGGIGAAALLVLTLLAQIPAVGIVCCCLAYLAYVAIGAGYGFFAVKNSGMVNVGAFALGGAISAAVAGIVQGIVGGILSLILGSSAAALQAIEQLRSAGYDVPPEVAQFYTTAGAGVASIFIGICCAFIIAAVLGAIGGAIYAAANQSRTPTAPAV
jgi:hypothetical protein